MQDQALNTVDEQLRQEVLACQTMSDFERLVSAHPERINEIAAILMQENEHRHRYFIRPFNPDFTALMQKFPPDFRHTIKLSITNLTELILQCSTTREFRLLVWRYKHQISAIAALLLHLQDHFQAFFINVRDPEFFDLVKDFPQDFKSAVNKEIQNKPGENTYSFDAELTQIVQNHVITIYNRSRDCTQDQDPIFSYLTAANTFTEPSHYLRVALERIKTDPRFLDPESQSPNAAGKAIIAYAKKRLVRERVKYCHNLSDFATLVQDFNKDISELATVILEEKEALENYFIRINDPQFFELLKHFPQNFRDEVDRVIQARYVDKAHAFTFDADLTAIMQSNAIEIINPKKECTKPQDPVFFYLTAVSPGLDPLVLLEMAIKAIAKDRRFLQPNSKRLNAVGLALIAYAKKRVRIHQLRKKLAACVWTYQYEAVVKEFKDHSDEITAVLLEDTIRLQIYFINRDDPSFFALLKCLPSEKLHQEVNRHILRWTADKSHAFSFDDDLNRIIQQHNISLKNPYKDCTQDQDPVFTYLIADRQWAVKQPIHHIKHALNNIKNDERFVHPHTHRLNDAGRAIQFYAKKRVAELEELEPSLFNKIKALWRHIKLAYLAVYGFDGYDITKHKVTTAKGSGPYEGVLLPFGLVLASFLGLPSRASHLDRYDAALPSTSAFTHSKPNYSPSLSLLQIARNFIGGWIPIREHGEWKWTEKKRWQVLALPFKIGIILPLKLATLPFKLALNILKLCTELLPALAVDAFKMTYEGLHQLARSVYAEERLGHLKILPALLLGLAALAVRLLVVALNIVKKVGIALTSPEKSAKMAFVYGRKSVLDVMKRESAEDIAFAAGVFLGFVSILTSAILWAIFLPVALSALVAYVPAVLQAVTWILHFPVVATSFGAIKGALLSVGTFLGTASTFGGAIGSVASLIGLEVASSVVLLASAFALLAVPLCAILSRIFDDLSNGWARWNSYIKIDDKTIPLLNMRPSLTPSLSESARKQADSLAASFNDTAVRSAQLEGMAIKAEDRATLAPIPVRTLLNNPAPSGFLNV